MTLTPGQILHNRYRIVKLLGQGGFGAVYKAWDMNLNGAVAVKENFDSSPAAQSQFAREASILFKLRHPNLPVVIDHFTLPGQGQYLVMDYIEGEDLEELRVSRGGRLDEADVLPWIGQVLDALGYMHAQQPAVFHRDIKPANIKITKSSDPNQPGGKAMLVDFGVAKVFDAGQRTLTGARAVTPGYAPFEQYGQAPTDARSDIYALGATLYTVLTGEVPVESLQRMAGTDLPRPRTLNPYLSTATENVILTAIQVQPHQRFQSAAQMKSALLPSQPLPAAQPMAQPVTPPVLPAQPYVQTQQASTWPVNQPGAGQVISPASEARPVVTHRQKVPAWLIGLVVLLLVGVVYLGAQQLKQQSEDRNTTQTANAIAQVFTHTPELTHTTRPTNPPTSSPTPEFTNTTAVTITKPPSPTSTPPPTLGVGSSMVSTKDQMVMVYIPAGDFMMGAVDGDSQARSDEKPRHKVYIDDFWMYSTEVTNTMYTLCVKANLCKVPAYVKSYSRPNYYDDDQFVNYPVIYVSWNDAKTYCEWAGGRLPTEAEWEKAARGGLDGKIYPWGDEAPVCDNNANNSANFGSCSQQDTTPAGYFKPNGYGLFDMAGNVWEWVADRYSSSYYSSIPVDGWPPNPAGPSTGGSYVLRGGAWGDDVNYLRVSDRNYRTPDNSYNPFGFRCVRSP